MEMFWLFVKLELIRFAIGLTIALAAGIIAFFISRCGR